MAGFTDYDLGVTGVNKEQFDNKDTIRGPLVWFKNDRTSANTAFTAANVRAGIRAAEISDNMTVKKATTGNKIAGFVLGVGNETDADGYPYMVQVAMPGVTTGLVDVFYDNTAPVVGMMVEGYNYGKVQKLQADADIAAGGHLGCGRVVNVDTTNTTITLALSS